MIRVKGDNMTPLIITIIIVVSLLVLLLTGIPVAFGLMGLSALLLLLITGPNSMLVVVASCFKQLNTEIFIAIPLFVFMAAILQFSGIAKSLYETMHIFMGKLKGGLAIGTIFICAIIAALSGIGATATTTMGLIALPEMLQRKYNKKLVLGSITVGGALGAVIPPSVLMIIIGGYAQLSVGKLFMGGIIPGILMTVGFSIYIYIKCIFRPEYGPAIQTNKITFKEKCTKLPNVIQPIALILFIIWGIYTGTFTPTEAAGFGALAAIVISIIQKRFTIKNIYNALLTTLKINSMIMWLVIGGGCYSSLINISGTRTLVINILQASTMDPIIILIIMVIIPLIMGMFIDPIAISMICIPIFSNICALYDINLLWYMLLFCIAVVIGYVSPPFGINIFYMKGVAPKDTLIIDIYRGIFPFLLIMILVLILCIIFPSLLLWLPSFM